MSIKQQITDYLIQKYHPVAILLHGSRARGLNRPNSDWDLCVFVDRDVKDDGPELWNGESLDIDVVKLPITKEVFFETFLGTLQKTEVLYEQQGAAQSVLALAEEIYEAPYDLSDKRRRNRKNYFHRLLLRLEGYVDHPVLFFYYLSGFYENIFPYWYELKGRWSQPLYVAWPEIQEEDPEYAELVRVLSSTASTNEKLDAAKQINQRLFSN